MTQVGHHRGPGHMTGQGRAGQGEAGVDGEEWGPEAEEDGISG